jgi:hypothetical protein
LIAKNLQFCLGPDFSVRMLSLCFHDLVGLGGAQMVDFGSACKQGKYKFEWLVIRVSG